MKIWIALFILFFSILLFPVAGNAQIQQIICPIDQWSVRQWIDRPDNTVNHQVHVMYVVPSDGVDNYLDVSGAICTSLLAGNGWLRGQTNKELRLDTSGSELDITFFRLLKTDAEMIQLGPFVRDEIEVQMKAAGFDAANKIYAVYYGGGSNWACGGGAWPPVLSGKVAALYLNGAPSGWPVPCSFTPLAVTVDAPWYQEFAMIHEVLHTLGFVPECAPHHHMAGHVWDSSIDAMYAGSEYWGLPPVLDVGMDDYFNNGCLDLGKSAFVVPTVESDVQLPPG